METYNFNKHHTLGHAVGHVTFVRPYADKVNYLKASIDIT